MVSSNKKLKQFPSSNKICLWMRTKNIIDKITFFFFSNATSIGKKYFHVKKLHCKIKQLHQKRDLSDTYKLHLYFIFKLKIR